MLVTRRKQDKHPRGTTHHRRLRRKKRGKVKGAHLCLATGSNHALTHACLCSRRTYRRWRRTYITPRPVLQRFNPHHPVVQWFPLQHFSRKASGSISLRAFFLRLYSVETDLFVSKQREGIAEPDSKPTARTTVNGVGNKNKKSKARLAFLLCDPAWCTPLHNEINV